jgi:Flp pilus assembly pilin Flp
MRILHRLKLLRSCKKGQDLIEYAMVAGFVAVAVAAFFPTSIAPSITSIFTKISTTLGLVN